ncbi:hypothetical protein GIB67_017225 [Kingdonia uniflora]|uniref:PPM-type phosphatase domain-containing protein n=1 Tax=Kingdonia uniflora TaxID=39325 RepID=A0A7J7NL35_9MAGN|nr:hypothetical protein GIB67_017225 [Kingdonia uniflora]
MARLEYRHLSDEDITKSCPLCRGVCNCKNFLRRYGAVKETKVQMNKPKKVKYSKYSIHVLLPSVKHFDEEQMKEKKVKAKIKAISAKLLYLIIIEVVQIVHMIFAFVVAKRFAKDLVPKAEKKKKKTFKLLGQCSCFKSTGEIGKIDLDNDNLRKAACCEGSSDNYLYCPRIVVDCLDWCEKKGTPVKDLLEPVLLHSVNSYKKDNVLTAAAEVEKEEICNEALLEMFRVDYIGDAAYISCTPHLLHHRLCSSDRFVVLSPDGLYQYFSNEEVVSHVAWFIENVPEGDPAQYQIAELLFQAAKKNGQKSDTSAEEQVDVQKMDGTAFLEMDGTAVQKMDDMTDAYSHNNNSHKDARERF